MTIISDPIIFPKYEILELAWGKQMYVLDVLTTEPYKIAW
eukprot:CAMPEP_0184685456 /NCGR_PEP_ID=MMETSP0312-20130426/19059_1 /TAXON_ID=31354 /ORGANISM="Compsopogon coeruleus, Strain SAG 36.94" /LENGTH=39 /DNA_ID= /DNA_START= /DNA_END= /DNA_ORIENTATION=